MNDNYLITKSRFADPTVDFAFKRIFGTEKYKAATIGLLNSLIKDHCIVDVKFLNSELIGETGDSRKAYIDVLCEDDSGAKFVVEMQKARQEHFRERTIFYASKLISMMPPQGKEWNYAIPPSYAVAFLDFEMEQLDFGEDIPDDCYLLHYVTQNVETQSKMPGSTEYYFLGIKDFNKKERELTDYTEKWLSLLGKTKTLEEIPEEYEGDETFSTYFEACDRAGFDKDEEQSYINDMMNEWDIANEKALERKEGFAEGMAEGMAKLKTTAQNLLQMGLSVPDIAKATGLSESEIKAL